MTEMRFTGYLHNHMRMHWGTKILEWSKTPIFALKAALYLNNKHFLDGRDPIPMPTRSGFSDCIIARGSSAKSSTGCAR